mmetsp:Transcript_26511/g.26388  ORF Transcript_26511/g.26388 Transcript_26511/m.26388 type:complete len:180 (+) Transcript_26511:1-540(+)
MGSVYTMNSAHMASYRDRNSLVEHCNYSSLAKCKTQDSLLSQSSRSFSHTPKKASEEINYWNIHYPKTPLSFENGICLIYRHNFNFTKEAFYFARTAGISTLCFYLFYKSLFGASGIIMKLIKSAITGFGFVFFTLSSPPYALKFLMSIKELYLEENGEYVIVSTFFGTKRFPISGIKA